MTDITGFLNVKEERGPIVVKVIDMVVRLTYTSTTPTEWGEGVLEVEPPSSDNPCPCELDARLHVPLKRPNLDGLY